MIDISDEITIYDSNGTPIISWDERTISANPLGIAAEIVACVETFHTLGEENLKEFVKELMKL